MNEKMSLTASLTESFKGLKKTKSLVFCALMLALQVILGNVTSIQLGPTLRISFQYLASAATGLLLGPGPALLAAAGADLIGFLIRPMGTYFFGFTLSAAVSGLIYGLFFYRRDVRLWRVLLAKLLFPEAEAIGAAAGVACVLGHIFPFYLKFRGGKGLASFWGLILALNWKLGLALFLLGLLITVVTDFISLAALSISIAAPVGMWFLEGGALVPLILCIATAVMVFKHIENIRRIIDRTEIGLRSTAKGEKRIQ